MKPSQAEFNAARRHHEHREGVFRAEAVAYPDPLLQPHRILKWVAERLGLKAVDVTFWRFPDDVAPDTNGFRWKGSTSIYLAESAGIRTTIHECIHRLKPDLCEYGVAIRAAYLAAELEPLLAETVDPPAVSIPDKPERIVEWDYSTG